MLQMRWLVAVGCVLITVGLLATGCGGGDGGGAKIALLLSEGETPRGYEPDDRPKFEQAVEEKCEDCEVLYSNAGGDASRQQSQAEAALTRGAEVLVVDPTDSKSAAAIAEKAKAQNVPVVSYDHLIENAEIDAYVSFDNEKVGEVQGEALVQELRADGSPNGPIVMINGDPADPNAALFKKGAHRAFKAAGVEIAKEYDTPGWSLENAQREARQAIAALGKDGFAGVYAADDETAGGAIAAMKGAGIDPSEKPVTGHGATLAGAQHTIAGEQHMTVYEGIEPEAAIGAEIAIALAEGEGVLEDRITGKVDNGKIDVPAVLLEPIAVTRFNIKYTVVADEFVKADELCTKAYASACKEWEIWLIYK
jgi:D-xylose transport system substrate-binding protein